jgi:hypothetical protein
MIVSGGHEGTYLKERYVLYVHVGFCQRLEARVLLNQTNLLVYLAGEFLPLAPRKLLTSYHTEWNPRSMPKARY